MRNLKIGRTVQGEDLPALTEGEYFEFIAFSSGQMYLGASEEGHSITKLTPIGSPIPFVATGATPLWSVTPIRDLGTRSGSSQQQRDRTLGAGGGD